MPRKGTGKRPPPPDHVPVPMFPPLGERKFVSSGWNKNSWKKGVVRKIVYPNHSPHPCPTKKSSNEMVMMPLYGWGIVYCHKFNTAKLVVSSQSIIIWIWILLKGVCLTFSTLGVNLVCRTLLGWGTLSQITNNNKKSVWWYSWDTHADLSVFFTRDSG